MKTVRRPLATLVLAIVVNLNGCARTQDWTTRIKEYIQNKINPDADPVLAKVGTQTIRRSDFIHYLDGLPAKARSEYAAPEQRIGALKNIVHQKTMIVLARKAGIPEDPEFQRSLKSQEESLLLGAYMTRLETGISVSSGELRDYYDVHFQDYQSDHVQFSRIVTASLIDARKVEQRLKTGQSFDSLARAFSIDRETARDGGRPPFTALERLDPLIQTALKKLQKGHTSSIIKTSAGFEIIRKDSDIQKLAQPFESVDSTIHAKLRLLKMHQRLSQAESTIPITIDEKSLKSIDLTSRSGSPAH